MDLHINYETAKKYGLERTDVINEGETRPFAEYFDATESDGKNQPKPKLKADKENGVIYIDSQTTLSGIPEIAWEYKLGNRSALEWILDQYKEKKPKDATIAEKFNNYKFADHKEKVIDLLQRVCTVSVKTMEIVKEMDKQGFPIKNYH